MFGAMFNSLGQELPASTQRLLTISSWLSSRGALLSIIFLLPISLGIKRWFERPWLKSTIDRLILHIPFLGILLLESKLIYFFPIRECKVQRSND